MTSTWCCLSLAVQFSLLAGRDCTYFKEASQLQGGLALLQVRPCAIRLNFQKCFCSALCRLLTWCSYTYDTQQTSLVAPHLTDEALCSHTSPRMSSSLAISHTEDSAFSQQQGSDSPEASDSGARARKISSSLTVTHCTWCLQEHVDHDTYVYCE